MNHSSRLVGSEYLIYFLVILQIRIHKLDFLLASDLLESLETVHLRVVKVVDYQNIVAFVDQFDYCMGADVAEATRDQYLLL